MIVFVPDVKHADRFARSDVLKWQKMKKGFAFRLLLKKDVSSVICAEKYARYWN